MNDELVLLSRWKGGDARAGQELFSAYRETLYRFFRNKVASGLEDLIQQTILACLENHEQFENRSSFRSYLLGVARFQLFEHYRRTKSDGQRLEFNTVTVHDMGLSPSGGMEQKGEQRRLLEALRRLPVNLQIALELTYWEELTGPELAEILEIPPDTVYSRLRRAKQLLREQLALPSPQLAETETDLPRWAAQVRAAVSAKAEEEPAPNTEERAGKEG